MGAGRHRLRRVLVIGEFALALALLAGAGLAIHSFWNLMRVDLGVKTDHVLTFFLRSPTRVPKTQSRSPPTTGRFSPASPPSPGSRMPPPRPDCRSRARASACHSPSPANPPSPTPRSAPCAGFGMVTPDYFQTFGIRLANGRTFTDQDTASSVKVAIVNEDFVKKFFKGTTPSSSAFLLEQLIPGVTQLGPPIEWQIVGVYHKVRSGGFREDHPEIQYPSGRFPGPAPVSAYAPPRIPRP